MISKITNSEIGTSHWFNALIGQIQRTGEFLSKNNPPNNRILKAWGKNTYEAAAELYLYYDEFSNRKVNISFTGTDIKNKEAFAEAMGSMIEKAIKQSEK